MANGLTTACANEKLIDCLPHLVRKKKKKKNGKVKEEKKKKKRKKEDKKKEEGKEVPRGRFSLRKGTPKMQEMGIESF